MRFYLFFLGAAFSTSTFATSPDDDAVLKDALKKTQDLLRSGGARNEEAGKTAKGREAINQVEKLGGSTEVNDGIYGLAADIFEDIFEQSKGNPEEMQRLLEKAQKDPEGFAKGLKSSRKEKLKSLSKQLPVN